MQLLFRVLLFSLIFNVSQVFANQPPSSMSVDFKSRVVVSDSHATKVATVTVSDVDDDKHSFSLSGPSSSDFRILIDGSIFLEAGRYEKGKTYSIIITATDSANNFITRAYSISFTEITEDEDDDDDDGASRLGPSITISSLKIDEIENDGTSKNFAFLTLSRDPDPDRREKVSIVVTSPSVGGTFSVQGRQVENSKNKYHLFYRGSIDYKVTKSVVLDVKVKMTDRLTSRRTFLLEVINDPSNDPIFPNVLNDFLSVGSRPGTIIGFLGGDDVEGEATDFSYSIVEAKNSDLFTIRDDGAILIAKPLKKATRGLSTLSYTVRANSKEDGSEIGTITKDLILTDDISSPIDINLELNEDNRRNNYTKYTLSVLDRDQQHSHRVFFKSVRSKKRLSRKERRKLQRSFDYESEFESHLDRRVPYLYIGNWIDPGEYTLIFRVEDENGNIKIFREKFIKEPEAEEEDVEDDETELDE